MTESLLYAIAAAVFGLLIGSFLNVCIYRWTRDLSVVTPRSACPGCNHLIAWYDNIPLVSYIILRRRCRHCNEKIPWTYPAVELLTTFFFCYFVAIEGPSLAALKDCLFAAIMIGLIFADLDTRLLPDEFTLGGFVVALAISPFVLLPPTVFGLITDMAGIRLNVRVISFGEAALGALIPSFGMWFLGWIFEKLRHKEYLGLGDVKMIAMMGAFLGTSGVIVTLLFGSLFGSVGGYAFLKITHKDPRTYYLPFATFLGSAALIVVAAHGGITNWYAQLLR